MTPRELLCLPSQARQRIRHITKLVLAGRLPEEGVDLRSLGAEIVYLDDAPWFCEANREYFFFLGIYEAISNGYYRCQADEADTSSERLRITLGLRQLVLQYSKYLWFGLSLLGQLSTPLPFSEDRETAAMDLLIGRNLLARVDELFTLEKQNRVIHGLSSPKPAWLFEWGLRLRDIAYSAGRVSSEQWEQFVEQPCPDAAIEMVRNWLA